MFFEGDEDLDEDEIRLRDYYRNMSDKEFKSIKPIWETNYNSTFAKIYHPYFDVLRIYVRCDLNILIDNSDNLLPIRFDGNFNGTWTDNESKFATTLQRWENGEGVDPPVIDMTIDNKFKFIDGRHRTVLAQFLGKKEIIASIPKRYELNAKEIINAQLIDLSAE